MALTALATKVALRQKELLVAKIDDTDFFDPAIQVVFYGDQVKIPKVPCVCIEPGIKERTWPPTPSLMTENRIETNIFIYHLNVNQGTEAVKLETDQLAEAIEEFFNINHLKMADADGNQMIIHGYVVQNEPGYTVRGDTLYHAARLLWRGITKTQLTVAG